MFIVNFDIRKVSVNANLPTDPRTWTTNQRPL